MVSAWTVLGIFRMQIQGMFSDFDFMNRIEINVISLQEIVSVSREEIQFKLISD